MIFSSQNIDILPLVIAVALYILILAFDVVVPWARGRLRAAINYISISLHIAFLLSLMFVGVYIEIPVLAFMISLFAYSFSSFIAYTREKKQKEQSIEPVTFDSREEGEPSYTAAEPSGKSENVSPNCDNGEVVE